MELTKAEERELRRLANATRHPVQVVNGGSPPTFKGEASYYTFRGGNTVVLYPGSARRHGYKLDYHSSTHRVEVGEEWVRQWRERRAWARSNRKRAQAFRELGGQL